MKTATLTEEEYDLIMAFEITKNHILTDIRKYFGILKDYSMNYWTVKKKSKYFSCGN